MFEIKGVKDEIDALKASGARVALLDKVPYFLFHYVAQAIGESINEPISVLKFSSVDSFKEYFDSEAINSEEPLTLKKGEDVSLLRLTDLGYERVNKVYTEGEFSLYVDVAVVWVHGYSSPYRISLFDKELEFPICNPDKTA